MPREPRVRFAPGDAAVSAAARAANRTVYSMLFTREEMEGIVRCELSAQAIARAAECLQAADRSDALLRKRGVRP